MKETIYMRDRFDDRIKPESLGRGCVTIFIWWNAENNAVLYDFVLKNHINWPKMRLPFVDCTSSRIRQGRLVRSTCRCRGKSWGFERLRAQSGWRFWRNCRWTTPESAATLLSAYSEGRGDDCPVLSSATCVENLSQGLKDLKWKAA